MASEKKANTIALKSSQKAIIHKTLTTLMTRQTNSIKV